MRSAIICLLLSAAVAVSADLQADIDDVQSHLPMKEIISIGKQYVAALPAYAEGLRYIKEISYQKLVRDFFKTKEGHAIVEYFNRLGIDAEKLYLHMTEKTVEVQNKWLEPIEDGEKLSPVITGDISADYRNVIVNDSDFMEAVARKAETSPQFAKFVAALKDPQFHALFYRVSNSKELGGHGKAGAQVRGFWKKVWNVTKVVAVASAILG